MTADARVIIKLGDIFGINDVCDNNTWENFINNIIHLFHDLDVDGSGTVERHEFVQGVMRVADSSRGERFKQAERSCVR